jgi:hypothetical protein
MDKVTIHYRGVDIEFVRVSGIVRGYNKFVMTTTNVSGGGRGTIRRSIFWEGTYHVRMEPVRTSTTHTTVTEFVLVEYDNRSSIPVRLVNTNELFYDGQHMVAWVERRGGRIFRLVSPETGRVSIVNGTYDLFARSGYYYYQFVNKNLAYAIVWWATVVFVVYWLWCGLRMLFRPHAGLLDLFTFAILLVPAVLFYRLVRMLIRNLFVRGVRKSIEESPLAG